jgi:hypothetical protein
MSEEHYFTHSHMVEIYINFIQHRNFIKGMPHVHKIFAEVTSSFASFAALFQGHFFNQDL